MKTHTEEHVLEDDRLLSQRTEVTPDGLVLQLLWPRSARARRHYRVPRGGRRHRLFLDAGPGEVDVEEQQQGAEADDGGVELVALAHEGVVQQVAVNLGLDEDEVDEEHHEVVLDVLVAEAAAVLAHRQPDVMPARRVARARVLRP